MYSVDLVKCKAQLREQFNKIGEARNPISATKSWPFRLIFKVQSSTKVTYV